MANTLKKKTLEELVDSLTNFTYDQARISDTRFKLLTERLDLQQDDITDIKRMVTQLVQSQASRDRLEIDTDRRLTKVEKHLKFV